MTRNCAARAAFRVAAVAAVAVLGAWATSSPTDPLAGGFRNPPDSARPHTWWHWMAGNISREGITLDLEWMKRAGIAGVQLFDCGMGIDQFVDHRIEFMTPEWKEMLRHAASECDRLGLEFAVHSSAGWSETGGPWVRPEQAMKKYVWSETLVDGPRAFSGALSAPPSGNSRFQNLPDVAPESGTPFYADAAVFAYPLAAGEVPLLERHPKVTLSSGAQDVSNLFDHDLSTLVSLPVPPAGAHEWIQLEFAEPPAASAFSLAVKARGLPSGELQASDDGKTFRTLVRFPGAQHQRISAHTYSFPETRARFYRLQLGAAAPVKSYQKPAAVHEIAEFDLSSGPRVNRWEEKAGFATMFEYDSVATPATAAKAAIAPGNVIDLTSKCRNDGTLEWNVPPGRWMIVRLGYSLTGQKNGPAMPTGRGYEVDKLDRAHVQRYFDDYANQLGEVLGPLFGTRLRTILMDSWEVGSMNWTGSMAAEFRVRRGYDPLPYLPVLTGRVVGNAEISDRFLWDFRRTIADLLAENHYGAFTEAANRRGLRVMAEAAGIYLPVMEDALQNKGHVDVPMGEFWYLDQKPGDIRDSDEADVREAASAAHIYGKKIVAAESFTTPREVTGWGQTPYTLKWLADRALALGVNQFVFHTSVHQPLKDAKPGLTMSRFGQHLTRNMTWAELANPFMSYLARNMYMMRQGLPVADIAYFYGEGAPAAVPYWESLRPEPPAGYSYDFVNTEVLLKRMSVRDGMLVLPDGVTYRILVLPENRHMTPRVLQRIRELVDAGATVVGPKPIASPSLSGYPRCDAEVAALADELWGRPDGRSVNEHAFGKGKVIWGKPLDAVLHDVPPDFEYTRPSFDTFLVFGHRRIDDGEIYFVANQRGHAEDLLARIRVTGRDVELWHPDTGAMEPAAYTSDEARTTVPVHLDPFGSVFVVARRKAPSPTRVLPKQVEKNVGALAGAWDVRFPTNLGAPPLIHLDKLISWTAHTDSGVRYFSGTATYTKDFVAPQTWFHAGARMMLDLGQVKEFAEVSLNGKPLGVLWKPPFRIDVTNVLRPGRNQLDVRITNLWPNRMIGDEQPGAKKYTFTSYKVFDKGSPLLDSGLLGPVTVLRGGGQ